MQTGERNHSIQVTWNDGMPAGLGDLARAEPGKPAVLCGLRATGGVRGLLLFLMACMKAGGYLRKHLMQQAHLLDKKSGWHCYILHGTHIHMV